MNKWHNTFINIAYEFAKHSTCCRKQVGAVLVKDRRIISTGYNGVPSGQIHCKDIHKNENLLDVDFLSRHRIFSNLNEIHAEANCILFAAKIGISTQNCSLYITLSPCINCAKLIVGAGIKEVFYKEEYEYEQDGIIYLKNNNIFVEQIL